MHPPESASPALAEEKGSFISEDNAMTVVDHLEICAPHDPSRQAGPSLDTTLPTLEREGEGFYGPPGKRDQESASILGSNLKEVTNEGPTTPTSVTEAAGYDFPDGGSRAWSVAIGSCLLAAATFGYSNSWIFQEYYSTKLLRHKSPSDIAWIGSVQYSLVLMPGIFSGRLLDLGHLRIPLAVASVIVIVAVFLSAECKEYWQFLLCQGFLLGLGAGFSFGPALPVTAHWFNKRRPIAYAVVAAGSSIGGVIFPLAVKRLIPEVGFKWTMRITGFVLVVMFGTANLLVCRRLPGKNVKGGLFNFRLFLKPAYTLYGIACILGFLGIYTLLTFADISVTEAGVDHNLAVSLVAIANGCSFFGRISSGYLAGRFGPLNVLLPWTVIVGVMTWVWPYATTSAAPIVVIMAIYGMASGAFMGLAPVPLSHPAFGEQGDLGRRMGMMFSLCAIGALCGTPISGAIHTAAGGYKAVGWFAGGQTMLCCIFLMFSRRAALGKWFPGY